MDEVRERIKELLAAYDTNATRLANGNGTIQRKIARQLKDTELSCWLLSLMLDTFKDVSAEWLLRGEGEMERKPAITPEIRFSSDVLKDIMNYEHLSEEQLADKIGMKIVDVKDILCSHRLLNEAEFVLVAAAFPNYDTAWIRTHTGSMIYSPVSGNNNSIVQNMTGNGVQTANNANSELVTEVAVLKAQLQEKEKQIDMLKELLMNK